ncbi:uncharacterized protein V6R79_011634 [Siganus canaliculatus]
MAAGRGKFFQSFLEGLDRDRPVDHLASGRGHFGPGKRHQGGRRRSPQRPAPCSLSGRDGSWPKPRTERKKAHFHDLKKSTSKENLLENLPSEILIKILSYLDATTLFSFSHVSKLFHKLANDDLVWQNLYVSEFGSQTWKPKSSDSSPSVDNSPSADDRSAGHWRRLYFRTMVGRDMSRWRQELKVVSPYTGLPRQTEWVLRSLNVSWELTLCENLGLETTLDQTRVYFFESSIVVRWSKGSFPKYHHISSLQLHGVRKEAPERSGGRKSGWRSLILKLDLRTCPPRFLGKDQLVRLLHLSPGFLIGIWRGQSRVAFIMATLHFHRLVERSLLGSLVCPYSEPVDLPYADNSDPEFGLHGYTLHFVLHNTGTEIMSDHFRQLSSRTVQIQRGLVVLKVIDRTNLSQHRSLSGNIKLPWKSGSLEGSVENCCIITLTLLDEFQKPFWCVSSPICVVRAQQTLSFDYGGEHFLMQHHSPEGRVEMKLVWLKEQKQFFLISLVVYISVAKVNEHFSRQY